MRFSKMHGIGNDYIFVNADRENIKEPNKLAAKLADRHFYVGSDGLVLIGTSSEADFYMRIFNTDGSEAEMCGNAIRCVGKYVYEKGLHSTSKVTIQTLAGIKQLQLDIREGKVRQVQVNMGFPIMQADKIPVLLETDTVVDYPLQVADKVYFITAVSMGNPHCVIFADTPLGHLPKEASLISTNRIFPRGTNVEFVEVVSRGEIRLRVYERGVGETLACGTGACASFYAAYVKGLVSKKVKAELKGGMLDLELIGNNIFMTGPADWSYEGEYLNDE